jgi:hypothetical protein
MHVHEEAANLVPPQQPRGLTVAESNILEALGTEILTGKDLAQKAGYVWGALPKTSALGVGAFAAIKDPEGNICGLWERANT